MALSPWPSTPAALATAVAALTAALRVSISAEDVARIGAVAAALVEQYCPTAPQSVRDEAVIRAAGWLREVKPGLVDWSMDAGPVNITRKGNMGLSALRHSGAMALLNPWKVRRAGKI